VSEEFSKDPTQSIKAGKMSSVRAQGKTMAEKLLSLAAGADLRAGELAIFEPHIAMGTDGSIPMALGYLRQMCADRAVLPPPKFPERLVFAFDHYDESSGAASLALQEQARAYARQYDILTFEIAEGIGHQLMIERGLVVPGQLAVGADSHAVSYGAFNAFGTGIGSSDFAGILRCGQVWLKVPASLRVHLSGALAPHVSAKDLALALAKLLGADGATYMAVEFDGPGVATLDMDDRIVVANMSVEMGAKAGLFPYDDRTAAIAGTRWQGSARPVEADRTATYANTIELDLSEVTPQVALPHRVDRVVDLARAPDTRVDMVYLGTCTGGRSKDLREALDILRRGGGVAAGVRLIVTPASQRARDDLAAEGMLAEFEALGGEIHPPGCGACCGTSGCIPDAGVNVVSTANRNFKGRMGNREANIYLASPAACAIAAVRGRLVDPREDAA
jgi:3-isopropylmalate/(R)-2-methylmalate dehydratase large subunit